MRRSLEHENINGLGHPICSSSNPFCYVLCWHHTGVLGEVGSSKCVCFFELDRPRDLELARLRFNVFEEPDRLSDFNNELSPPPSPSPRVVDSFLAVVGTSSFSYFEQKIMSKAGSNEDV